MLLEQKRDRHRDLFEVFLSFVSRWSHTGYATFADMNAPTIYSMLSHLFTRHTVAHQTGSAIVILSLLPVSA